MVCAYDDCIFETFLRTLGFFLVIWVNKFYEICHNPSSKKPKHPLKRFKWLYKNRVLVKGWCVLCRFLKKNFIG